MLDRALAEAFDRMDAFCAVQRGEHGSLTIEGVELLQEAVGVGDAERRLLLERLPAMGESHPGGVLLGVLLGLFAAEAARR
jgi:hypothetical protein